MKEIHKVSVVIPIYNVQEYLNECVSSIVNQTYQNLEIILVDDGSPDSCPIMCDAWKNQDDRITVIHKKNGGLSDARNAGLAKASGVAYPNFIRKFMIRACSNPSINHHFILCIKFLVVFVLIYYGLRISVFYIEQIIFISNGFYDFFLCFP